MEFEASIRSCEPSSNSAPEWVIKTSTSMLASAVASSTSTSNVGRNEVSTSVKCSVEKSTSVSLHAGSVSGDGNSRSLPANSAPPLPPSLPPPAPPGSPPPPPATKDSSVASVSVRYPKGVSSAPVSTSSRAPGHGTPSAVRELRQSLGFLGGPSIGDCDTEYEKLEQCGEGTYGQVFKARHRKTGEIVALKRLRMDNENEGFPITAIREIRILKGLRHDNIVRLKEIVTTSANKEMKRGAVSMVLEYVQHDLAGLIQSRVQLRPVAVKTLLKQLLEGVAYMHRNKIMHRDLKCSNLLIGNDGCLKIADLGLARPWNAERKNLTNRVITLWYRPPELLLGSTDYTTAIDMWSVGCIFAELLSGKPLMCGSGEIEQLNKIFELMGHPTPELWADVKKYPQWPTFDPVARGARPNPCRLERHFQNSVGFTSAAVDLLKRMLCLNPHDRISAERALDHDYFWQDPMPDVASLPKSEGSLHEYEVKQKKYHQPHQQQQLHQSRHHHQQQQQQQARHHGHGHGGRSHSSSSSSHHPHPHSRHRPHPAPHHHPGGNAAAGGGGGGQPHPHPQHNQQQHHHQRSGVSSSGGHHGVNAPGGVAGAGDGGHPPPPHKRARQ